MRPDWAFVSLLTGVVASLFTSLGMALAMYRKQMAMHSEQVRSAFKVELMWNSWLKHAENLAETSGLLVKNSPIRLTEAGLKIFRELSRDAEFRNFWLNHSHDKSVDQVSAIERILGDKLLDEMRQKNGVNEIEIVISGIQYAREISEPFKTEAQKAAGT